MDTIQTTVFTQAPEGADYWYSKSLESFEANPYLSNKPRTFRKVQIDATHYQTRVQLMRYGSFLGGFPTLDDPREVPFGLGRSPDMG